MRFALPLLGALVLARVAAAYDSAVVFNEIQYHPAPGQPEFIELRSLQGVDVSIAGWRIEGGVEFTFPPGTIVPGGGHIVVAGVAGAVPGALGPFSGTLDNAGETLRLRNLNGRLMDEVEYDDEGAWPTGADGSGASLARRTAGAAPAPSAWTTSVQLGGTPGSTNFPHPDDPPTVTTLVALDAAWKFRDDNAAQPAGWTAVGFDDSGWASGPALLYAGSPNVTGAGEGLHGYWPLEETSGTNAPNLAPGGTNGTVFNGATWVTDGTRGRVLNFDGVSGYVNAGFLPQMTLTNDFTWSFWAFSGETGGDVVLGNRRSPSDTEWVPREFIKFTPSTLQFDYNDVRHLDYADMPLNSWVHHAVIKQGANFSYYRNGVAAGGMTITSGQNNAQPFYFGGDKTIEKWPGRLDDIAVWTKALPASSVTGLANGSLTPLTAPTGSSGAALTTQVTQGPTTHYFRRAFTFSGAKERTTLALRHLVDDGAVFYLNGTEVHRVNLPGGAIAHSTPASSDIGGANLSGEISIPTTALVAGTNVLAVEVHQHAANPDMVFGATLIASEAPAAPAEPSLHFHEIAAAGDPGFFVELRNTAATAVQTDGWTIRATTGHTAALPAQSVAAGGFLVLDLAALGFAPAEGVRLFLLAPGGTELRDGRAVAAQRTGLLPDGQWGFPTSATPGAANLAAVSDAIVINEIFYHAPGTSPEQWIELHNRSAAPVDVGGWRFAEGVTFTFPPGTTVAAGGFLVVAWDPAAFTALHPGVAALGPWSGSLSGKGETITLRDANGNVADEVTYADGGRWSQWADGGGSSLELRDRDADNSKPEAWDASDESAHSSWQNVSYSGLGVNPNSSDPTTYHEFVLGLLNRGEFLIDDISVKNVTLGNVELIQNGAFSGGTAATWRIIGTHAGSIVSDPHAGGNPVLKIAASGATEHMHNHAETTLKNGGSYHTINNGNETSPHTYSISFRAKWLRGSNRLHTRLWHNRLPRQTELNRPTTGGTPGAVNGRAVANLGPTFDLLAHAPVVPAAGEAVTVRVRAADPDGVGAVQLFTSVNGGGFTSVAMTAGEGGVYSAGISGKAAGALVQFYIRATDGLGAVSFFPPAGTASRAMIPWADGRAQLQLASGARPHNVRIVLPAADATEMYKLENLMSDAAIPCTIIYDEREAYYHAGVRLRSSEHGRFVEARCGFTLEFGSDELFLGKHDTVSIDRSGGSGTGQKEILVKTLSNLAGGVYASEDDIIRVISPLGSSPPGTFTGASMTSPAIMSKTRLDRDYLDGQWLDGGDGAMQKYERVYVLTQTIDPATRIVDATIVPENPKIPQATTAPPGVAVTSLGANKENYRWYWLIQNARDNDDYSGIMAVTNAVGQPGGSGAFNTLTAQHIDVSSWLRATVPATLFGVTDNYLGTGTGQHNALVYFPPGKKAVLIPWDLDFLSHGSPTAPIATGGDVGKFIVNGANKRLYYGHLLDVLNRSFNTATMTHWATHYSRFSSDDMIASVSSYLTPRAAHAMNVLYGTGGQTAPIPPVAFARTGASPTTVSTPFATVTGDGWIDVAEIRLQGSVQPLAVTWTDDNSWSVQLPVSAGTHTYTLMAFDSAGTQIGTASVTITGSGGVFAASAGTLVLSEIHYNPADSGDATEFVELWNITDATLDLRGCHFDEENGEGISYTFPAGVQIPPGGRILVVRDRAAFLAAYPTAGPLAPGQFAGALDNAGEMLVLYAASGVEIFRLTYEDEPASTDGDGRSLVRVLSTTNPDANSFVWRASTGDGGNPGASDAVAFAGVPLADDDFDGLRALLEYALGLADHTPSAPPWTLARDASGFCLLTFPRAIAADDVVLSIEAAPAAGGPWNPAIAVRIASIPQGAVELETWRVTPPVNPTQFFLQLRATPR